PLPPLAGRVPRGRLPGGLRGHRDPPGRAPPPLGPAHRRDRQPPPPPGRSPPRRGPPRRPRPGAAVTPQDLERLAALSAISRTLNASYRLDDVLARAMDVSLELLGAQRGFLMLDRGGDRPEVVAARGLDAAPKAWS